MFALTTILRRRVASFCGALGLALATANGVLAQPYVDALTLPEALARAASADPASLAADARILAAEANLRQAGVRLNPTVGADLENFPSTALVSRGQDQTQATVYYQQTIERGGKRDARTGLARSQAEVARLRRQVARLDLLRDVQVAFAEAFSGQMMALAAESRLAAALAAERDIDRRVRSARDPLFAGARAETQTAQAQIARDQAHEAARSARATLAAYWGGGADFTFDLDRFFDVTVPTLADAGPEPADLALLQAEREVAIATVRLEQSRAVPDPTLRAGVRYLSQGSDVAFVVGGSIPLQRYDTNRGAIERAQAERNAAELDIAARRISRQRETARLITRLAAAATESDRIAAEVLPRAQRTVELVTEGFNRGGFQYIDVTEAQRALVEARARRVEVLRQFYIDQAALDRLLGRQSAIATNVTPTEPR